MIRPYYILVLTIRFQIVRRCFEMDTNTHSPLFADTTTRHPHSRHLRRSHPFFLSRPPPSSTRTILPWLGRAHTVCSSASSGPSSSRRSARKSDSKSGRMGSRMLPRIPRHRRLREASSFILPTRTISFQITTRWFSVLVLRTHNMQRKRACIPSHSVRRSTTSIAHLVFA